MSEIDALRIDLRELKLKIEKLFEEVSQKSNIKDVCALIDLKANIEDVDKNFDLVYQEMQGNSSSKITIDKLLAD